MHLEKVVWEMLERACRYVAEEPRCGLSGFPVEIVLRP